MKNRDLPFTNELIEVDEISVEFGIMTAAKESHDGALRYPGNEVPAECA